MDPKKDPDPPGIPPSLQLRGCGCSLLLGEDRPREAIGCRGVNQLQDILVLLLWVDVHGEDGAKDFL